MTHLQLIVLLVGYVAVVAFGFAYERLFPLSEAIRANAAHKEICARWSKARILTYGICIFVVSSVFAIGVVGMFLLWHPAPWLFTIAGICMIVTPAFPWYAMSGIDKTRLEMEMFLAGFISALTLFGPAKHLFE